MKVEVHHRDHESGKLVHVANIAFEGQDIERALDYAWSHSNNVGGSWSRGPFLPGGEPNEDFCGAVERLVPLPQHLGREYGLRSSMVGDVFVIESASERSAHRIASFGFEPCELPA